MDLVDLADLAQGGVVLEAEEDVAALVQCVVAWDMEWVELAHMIGQDLTAALTLMVAPTGTAAPTGMAVLTLTEGLLDLDLPDQDQCLLDQDQYHQQEPPWLP